MSASLSEVLLRIAASIAADGGASVRATLEGVLREAAPFDAGEVAFVRSQGDTWRQPLGTTDGKILGFDLLEHAIAQGAACRIDDWRDAEPFPEALGLLRARALRSLLVVPFRFDAPGGPPLKGALAVGRSQGWAFAGASLPFLVPLAGMAGLALDRSLVLTTLGERALALEDVSPAWRGAAVSEAPVPAQEEAAEGPNPLVEEAQRMAAEREHERDRARDEADTLRRDAEGVATSLREERAKGRDLLLRAEAAEERLLLAERSRDEWAQKAASLRTRNDEQGAEMETLRRGMAGARETAASAADMAESGQGRIRQLQQRALELEATILALEGEVSARAARLDETESAASRLEGERSRLEAELKQSRVELGVALDQKGALSATPAASRGHRAGRKPGTAGG